MLAKRPSEMTVLDVVNAVDPIKRIERCPLDLKAHGESLCSLHQRLDAATALMERAFAETTVADVLAEEVIALYEGTHSEGAT